MVNDTIGGFFMEFILNMLKKYWYLFLGGLILIFIILFSSQIEMVFSAYHIEKNKDSNYRMKIVFFCLVLLNTSKIYDMTILTGFEKHSCTARTYSVQRRGHHEFHILPPSLSRQFIRRTEDQSLRAEHPKCIHPLA